MFAELTLLSMAIIAFLPKLTKKVPAGLTAILVVFGLAAALVIDTKTVGDISAIEALNRLTARYAKAGKKVHLRHLSEDCRTLIDKAESIIEVNHFEDPTYEVVRDVR